MPSSHPVYDQIGCQYSCRRLPDPRIAEQIRHAIGNATTVCNIGAGTGSYEPDDEFVVAVEPSEVMIRQRKNSHTVVRAVAEQLPFADGVFEVAMTVLSLHHCRNARQGLSEMQRISRRQVVVTFDPDAMGQFWFLKDYVPEIVAFEKQRTLSVTDIASQLQARAEVIPVPWDCRDGFQAAYWRRPEQYLLPEVHASISTFAQLPATTVQNALQRLQSDLETGVWHEKYGNLLTQTALDCGYRILYT